MGATILIVDDDPQLRALVTDCLQDEGYTVVEAADGAAALRRLGEGPCDLVLCDVFMPNMDGLETLQAIKRRWPDLPVVMLSGGGSRQPSEGVLNTARLLGAAGGLTKPMNLDALRVKVWERVGFPDEKGPSVRAPDAAEEPASRGPSGL